MWDTVLFSTISALAAGSMALPVVRTKLGGDIEHDWLADELEFDCIEPDDKTVRLKSGAYFRVFKIRGISYDAQTQTQQEQLLKLRTSLFHTLGEANCSLRLFAVKRQHDISFNADWPSSALTEIGEAERQEYRSSYYIDWYLAYASTSLKTLVETTSSIHSSLSPFKPQILERADDPEQPCPLTAFVNYLVCGDIRDDLPAESQSLSGSLPASDLTADKKSGIIETRTPTTQYHQVVSIREWPELISGKLFAEILALQGDIELSQTCIPWDRDKALVLFKRKVLEQSAALLGNPTLANEYQALIQLLTEGNTTVFHTQLHVIVRCESEDKLKAKVSSVAKILGKRRIKYSIETAGAPICWFNRMPEATPLLSGSKGLLRPLTLRDQNIAALWTFNHSPVGMMKSPFGDRPVRFFRTPSGQAYAFQFQVSEKKQSLGNFLVFAPSGSGKSTLLLHLLGGLAKFDGVRSYILDSKEGARFMVEALGGIYQNYDSLQLNALDVGEDTPANRHRIHTILKAMSASAERSEDDDQILAHAIECAFKLSPPERTLNAIYEFAFPKRTPLRSAFSRWVTDGKGNAGLNAHIFNAPHDSLGSMLNSSHMVGINMNEALEDPIVGPPVVTHISSAIFKSAAQSSKGFVMFTDEAGNLLQNPGYLKFKVEAYREIRKLDGCVGMAFQDPKPVLESGEAGAFLDNTSLLAFFPNSNATNETLDPFNLNAEHKAFIHGDAFYERKAGQRQVLIIKRDAATGYEESSILDIDLSPLGSAMRYYRAGVEANRDLTELQRQWGEAWREHL